MGGGGAEQAKEKRESEDPVSVAVTALGVFTLSRPQLDLRCPKR